jgi:phosphinothricin acetyltransferase
MLANRMEDAQWCVSIREVTTDMAQIRLARSVDAAAVAAIYAPFVEQTAISFENSPPGEQEMARRINETLSTHPWLVCELEGRVVGYAYATRHRERAAYRWSADASVYVETAYQRRGAGRALYESLFAVLAAQGFVNVYAGISLPNAASVALHESFGFEPVGVYHHVGYKLGAWHDVGWWRLALTRPDTSPSEPLTLAAARAQADWDELLGRGQSFVRALPQSTDASGRDSLGSQFAIRQFQTVDEAPVIALWQRCGLLRPWNNPHQDIARKRRVRPDLFLVGEANGQIVATVMAGYDGHRGWINYLAVAPDQQRRGLGRAIMREAERRLAAAGCPKINLQIRNGNHAVIAFYRALGYVGDDVISMGRRLQADGLDDEESAAGRAR